MSRRTVGKPGYSTLLITLIISSGVGCSSKAGSTQRQPDVGNRSTTAQLTSLNPYGQLNPDAPPETAQFDFLVGSFDCNEQMRQPGGPWTTSRGTWTARYVLDGWLIEDIYIGTRHSFLGVRFIDRETRDWSITFYGAPGDPDPTTWTGRLVDGSMKVHTQIVLPDQRPATIELSFHDVTTAGFKWQNATLVQDSSLVTWTLDCTRTKP